MLALIVDDSITARMIVGFVLKDLGFETLEASEGSDALRQLREGPRPDLMTLDWNMPGLNGGQILDVLEREKDLRPGKILVVTSETEMRLVQRSMQKGADEYLMKPFTTESILAKLEMLGLLPAKADPTGGERP